MVFIAAQTLFVTGYLPPQMANYKVFVEHTCRGETVTHCEEMTGIQKLLRKIDKHKMGVYTRSLKERRNKKKQKAPCSYADT